MTRIINAVLTVAGGIGGIVWVWAMVRAALLHG
jgi:hypothetical protein